MSTLHIVVTALAGCNPHFCIYAAWGLIQVLQGACAFQDHKYDEAREHGVHGAIYLILGLT